MPRMMTKVSKTSACLAQAAVLFCTTPALAEPVAHIEAGLRYVSNVASAQLKQEIKGDSVFTVAASAGQFITLADGDSITATGDLESRTYRQFSGLSDISLGGTLAYKRKLGLGLLAPYVRFTASAAYMAFQNSVRDGWSYYGVAEGGKRINERLAVNAQYKFEQRTADHKVQADPDRSAAAFDQKRRSLLVNGEYSVGERVLLLAGYRRQVGDVVSTSAINAGLDAVTTAETPDTVFGPNASAYKLRATTQVISLGISLATGVRSSMNMGIERLVSHSDGDNNYYSNIATITYVQSF